MSNTLTEKDVSLLQDAREYLTKAKCTAWTGVTLSGESGSHHDCPVCKGLGYVCMPENALECINMALDSIRTKG